VKPCGLKVIPSGARANFSHLELVRTPPTEDEKALHTLMVRWVHALERHHRLTSDVLGKGVGSRTGVDTVVRHDRQRGGGVIPSNETVQHHRDAKGPQEPFRLVFARKF